MAQIMLAVVKLFSTQIYKAPCASGRTTSRSLLEKPARSALLQHQRVPMHTRHEAQPDGPSYGFCDLPLVLRAETRLFRMLYAAHLRHVLRHDGEILDAISPRALVSWYQP